MDKTSLISELLSQIWFRFALLAPFGFLTGLEFREYIMLRGKERPEIPAISLGTSRTFTFIAILGYLLFILDPDKKAVYSSVPRETTVCLRY